MFDSRDRLIAAVLATAPPTCAAYLAENRGHAERTAVLVAKALLRAKTVRPDAAPLFYAAVADLMAWVKSSPSALDLARSLVNQDRATVDDELRACVPAGTWAERCIAIDVALEDSEDTMPC